MKTVNIQLVNSNIRWFSVVTLFFLLILSQQSIASGFSEDKISAACTSPTWASDKVYTKGDKVSFQGIVYEASYWTKNQNPASNNAQWGPWVVIGPCDGGDNNIAPTVVITSPQTGTTFTSGDNISINANANDIDGSISNVAFYVDGNLLSEDSSAPYATNWIAVSGNHMLTAIATDNDNARTTSATIRITVSGGGSSSCDTPQYIEDGGYIAGSQVQNEGVVYECKPWPFTGWCNGAADAYAPGSGSYWEDAWIRIRDCDSGGNGEPTVSITSPSNGQTFIEGSNVTINVNATDSDGSISKVEFFSNGNKIGEDTSSPYNFTINAGQIGNYVLTAKAFDNDNLSSISSPVNIRFVSSGGGTDPLPARIMNGYWHNFQNGSGLIPLRDVSSAWDIINISFAEPKISSTDGEMGFELSSDFNEINYTESDFRADIQLLQSQGKKVIISIGGAEGQVRLTSISARDKFVSSMIDIIETYGFDGVDIDFEGQSLALEFGDSDFRNPTTPLIVNTINAVRNICNRFGNDFILTMAPETFFVQLGYQFYGGISSGADRRAGAYLPLIHALRDKLTFLQVQYYNSGPITALDDQFYAMGNSDFYVALVDMLLQGFPITKDANLFFPALRPDQVLIGAPSYVQAGGGFTGSQGVIDALDYLINGNSFGGQYQISQTYPDLRGVMSWSINWDKFGGFAFSNPVRAYLDGLSRRSAVIANETVLKTQKPEVAIFPNPFKDYINLTSDTLISSYTIKLYNNSGIQVFEHKNANNKNIPLDTNIELQHLKSGVYFYKIILSDATHTGRLIKE